MPSYRVAHVNHKGRDVIIVPLDKSYGLQTPNEQEFFRSECQKQVLAHGLTGTIVPVWDVGDGRMAIIAPTEWQGFLRTLTMTDVVRNLNRVLEW